MPKPSNEPTPSYYLVERPATPGPLWVGGDDKPSFLETFPLPEDDETPTWIRLPQRRLLEASLYALPTGARSLKLYDPTGTPEVRVIFAAADPRVRFLFVSEGFGDSDASGYFTAATNMATKILGVEPFRSARSHIEISGLYLPLAGSEVIDIKCGRSAEDRARLRPTIFGTQSCVSGSTERLWAGDETRVLAVVRDALDDLKEGAIETYDFLAVLIGSTAYGGAGSSSEHTARPRLAWATTGHNDSPEILLHELGHAFGLQDEYTDPYSGPEKPWRNISEHETPSDTPWDRLVSEERDSLTLPKNRAWIGKADAVGTFQGAGYDEDYRFRPSFDCRMRHLGRPFCPVCSEVIFSRLSGRPSLVARED